MYGKLNNGALIPAPNPVVQNGVQIFNPEPAIWAALGYLPVQQTAQPEDGRLYDCHFEEENGHLVQRWTEAAPTAEALLAVLTGEDEA